MSFLNSAFLFLAQVGTMGKAAAGKAGAATGKAVASQTARNAAGHQAAQHQGSNPIYSLVLIVVMILVFWLLLIRPQQKQRKKQEAFIDALKVGDQVYTTSGIIGRITGIDTNLVTLEIANNTRIKVIKSQVGGYFKPGEKPQLDSDKR